MVNMYEIGDTITIGKNIYTCTGKYFGMPEAEDGVLAFKDGNKYAIFELGLGIDDTEMDKIGMG